MSGVNKLEYDVFLLDMWADEDGDWQENERHRLGELVVRPAVGAEVDANDILNALRRFSYPDTMGRRLRALDTTDRRRVYAEDLHGSGEWWEVGTVKNHMPVYGLKLKEEVA